jgi:hypothetical protein
VHARTCDARDATTTEATSHHVGDKYNWKERQRVPSVWWFDETICELLTYGSTLLLGAAAYCQVHTGGSLFDLIVNGLTVHFGCTVPGS